MLGIVHCSFYIDHTNWTSGTSTSSFLLAISTIHPHHILSEWHSRISTGFDTLYIRTYNSVILAPARFILLFGLARYSKFSNEGRWFVTLMTGRRRSLFRPWSGEGREGRVRGETGKASLEYDDFHQSTTNQRHFLLSHVLEFDTIQHNLERKKRIERLFKIV